MLPKVEMTSEPDDSWVAGDAYEAYMGRWSRPIARLFVEWLGLGACGHWLEIGCGTGALTSAILDLGQPASVVACDPSEGFIAHARTSLSDSRATFIVADAGSIPHRDGGFDAVVSGLALNFVSDPEKAMIGVRERLRPEGSAAAYVWDYADGMEFLRYFWEEAVKLDSRAVPFDERHRFPLCCQEELAKLFGAAGFSKVETCALETATEFAGFDDFWIPFLRGTGPAPAYISSLDESMRYVLRERLRRRLGARDVKIQLHTRALAVHGISTGRG